MIDYPSTEEIVEEINKMPDFAKAMMYGKALRADETNKLHKTILGKMYREGRGYYVTGMFGTYALIEAEYERDEAPFTSAYCSDDEWKLTNTFFKTPEEAIFHAIGCMKEGTSSKFSKYASAMLNINN
jgi:hypothetical protein